MLISVGSLTTRGKCNEIKKKRNGSTRTICLKFLLFLIYLLFMAFAAIIREREKKVEKCLLRDKSTSRKMSQFILVSCVWHKTILLDSYCHHKSNDFSNFLFNLLPLFLHVKELKVMRNGKSFSRIINNFWIS